MDPEYLPGYGACWQSLCAAGGFTVHDGLNAASRDVTKPHPVLTVKTVAPVGDPTMKFRLRAGSRGLRASGRLRLKDRNPFAGFTSRAVSRNLDHIIAGHSTGLADYGPTAGYPPRLRWSDMLAAVRDCRSGVSLPDRRTHPTDRCKHAGQPWFSAWYKRAVTCNDSPGHGMRLTCNFTVF
jgi:hypothetical protein